MNGIEGMPGSESDSGQLWESLLAGRSRRFAMLLGGLFVMLLLAGTIVPIGGAVVGVGQLGVESRVKRVAHPTGGAISQILVKDGDRVHKGDVLVRLDTAVAGIRADLSTQTVDQLLAKRARLEAESEGRGMAVPSSLPTVSGDPGAQKAMAAEFRLYRQRASERQEVKAQLAQRILQLEKQAEGYSAQIAALQKQMTLIEPERKGMQQLWEKGLVTIGRRNQLERSAADIEGMIASLRASIAETGARITETRQQAVQLDQSARADAGTELAQVNTALNDQQVQQVGAKDAFARSEIRAPYDGVVDKMAFASVGEVVRPAETIMEIVPDSDRLVVEARVSPANIDQVRVGQDARVRLTAYTAQATPEIAGKVIFVSAEVASEPETGLHYFRVRMELEKVALGKEKLRLVSGMPVEVFISTRSRSMLSYLTKPLADQFARAFRN